MIFRRFGKTSPCRSWTIMVTAMLVVASAHAQAPLNLGPAVNTTWDDFVPLISADGKTLYFTRAIPPKREEMEYDLDIYSSKRQPDGTWSTAEPLGPPLNTWDLNEMLSISPDEHTALLGRQYRDDGDTQNGFSISHLGPEGWSVPVDVEFDEYVNNSRMRSASLCADGKTLLLAIEADDSRGSLDLYVSFMDEEGEFSEPMNLGDDLNTEELEASPFLAPDGATLYFSSAGHGGYGNNDIFMSRRLDETWKRWSPPVNLGPQVNGPQYDASYTISAAGDFAYMVSYRNTTGGKDIFEVPLKSEVQPLATVLVTGHAIDARTRKPIAASIRYEQLSDGREIGWATALQDEGYSIALPTGGRYGVRAEAPGYYALGDSLDLSDLKRYREERRDLYLIPIVVGETVRLNNVFFESGSADISPLSFPELNRVAAMMEENSGLRISISGHTDNVGAESDNLRLSRDRSRAVVEYLLARGIDADRLQSEGYGSTRPTSTNDTPEGRRLNRRVEFTVVAGESR